MKIPRRNSVMFAPGRHGPRRQTRYRFFDHWRARGSIEEAAHLLLDTASASAWWPLSEFRELKAGGPDGAGRRIAGSISGLLPYTVRCECRLVRVEFPNAIAGEIHGDLDGWVVAMLSQARNMVNIKLEMDVRVETPLLRGLSLLCRPLLCANHGWALRRGERGFRAELLRRRATADAPA